MSCIKIFATIKTKVLHTLSLISLLGIFLIAALGIPNNTIIIMDSTARAIGVGICLLVFASTQLLSQKKQMNFHSVDAWWFILIFISGLSALWSFNANYAIYGMFTTILVYCCFSAYQSSSIKSEENINIIFWIALSSLSLILLLLAVALVNFIAAENIDAISKSKFTTIIFRNSDLLVSVALLISPYVAFAEKKVHKSVAPILFIILSIIVLAIQPLKAILIIGFLVLTYILFNAKLSQITKYIILGSTIALFFLGLIYGPVNKVVLASQTNYTKESINQEERISLWKNSIELVEESPLIGYGKNNWELAIAKYGYNLEDYEYTSEDQIKSIIYPKKYTHSYNVASQLLSELGIIGIIAFLYIAILPCFRLINERTILSKLEVAALISVLTFFLLGLVYGSPLNYYRNFQGPVIVALIGLAIINAKSNKSTVLFTTHNKLSSLIILIGSILTISYFGRIKYGERLQTQALNLNSARDYVGSEIMAAKSLSILPESKTYQILFQSLLLQERNDEATSLIKEAVEKDPYNISLLYIYGEQLLKAGDIITARFISNKIKTIAPHYLYNQVLATKCDLIERPTSKNYQRLIKIKTDLHDYSDASSQEVYIPEILYANNVIVEIARFLNQNKSKVYKHIN